MATYETSYERAEVGPHAEYCFIHNVWEWSPRSAGQCFECKHIFLGPEALIQEWNVTATLEGWSLVSKEEDVPFCPHCLHDFI
jgi:hypothetical protein